MRSTLIAATAAALLAGGAAQAAIIVKADKAVAETEVIYSDLNGVQITSNKRAEGSIFSGPGFGVFESVGYTDDGDAYNGGAGAAFTNLGGAVELFAEGELFATGAISPPVATGTPSVSASAKSDLIFLSSADSSMFVAFTEYDNGGDLGMKLIDLTTKTVIDSKNESDFNYLTGWDYQLEAGHLYRLKTLATDANSGDDESKVYYEFRSPVSVPEPGSLGLMAMMLAALGWSRRRS